MDMIIYPWKNNASVTFIVFHLRADCLFNTDENSSEICVKIKYSFMEM